MDQIQYEENGSILTPGVQGFNCESARNRPPGR